MGGQFAAVVAEKPGGRWNRAKPPAQHGCKYWLMLKHDFWELFMCLRFLALIFLGFSALLFSVDSFAQSRCPLGTHPGSMDCAIRGHSVIRYEGYGAYVKSMSGNTTYWVTGADSGGLAGVTADAMTACQRAGNDDCEVLGTWRNSCASVGSVNIEGVKQIIFKTASNGWSSKRAVRQECAAISPGAECKVHKAVCIDFRTDLVPYY